MKYCFTLQRFVIGIVALAFGLEATLATPLDDPDSWPTIDFRELLRHESSMESIADQVATAFATRGFFFAITDQSLDHVYAASRQAHRLPLELKRELAGQGYSGMDVNVPELAYEPGKQSTVAAFDYAKHSNTFVDTEVYKTPDCLQPIVSDLYDWQVHFGRLLFRVFARALKLPETTFSQHLETAELGTLRLLRYPPQTKLEQTDLVGISAHTDFEAFTTMHQTTTGLQVRARDSKVWETVPLISNATLVIVGDVMERWTNGHWKATPHRVLPTEIERYAIIRFHAVAGETVIYPLPEFVSPENPAKYSRTTMEEIMRVITTNLQEGKGAWDAENDRSATADYDYQSCLNHDEQCHPAE